MARPGIRPGAGPTKIALSLVFWSLAGCAPVNPQTTVLVEYHRSGGIAGREDRLVVRSDGTAHLSQRGIEADFTVAPDTLAQLRTLLAGIDFASLRAEYLPARRGADLFEYVVVYEGRRVRTMDTAVPDTLQPLLQLLSRLTARR